MDWNTILDTALGTMGGTLITVLAAWGIYVFEKKDISKRNKKDRILDSVNESTNIVIKINEEMTSFQNTAYLANNINPPEIAVNYIKNLADKTQHIYNLVSEFEVRMGTLDNLSDLNFEIERDKYASDVRNLLKETDIKSEESYIKIGEKIVTIKNVGISLLNELQDVMKENVH